MQYGDSVLVLSFLCGTCCGCQLTALSTPDTLKNGVTCPCGKHYEVREQRQPLSPQHGLRHFYVLDNNLPTHQMAEPYGRAPLDELHQRGNRECQACCHGPEPCPVEGCDGLMHREYADEDNGHHQRCDRCGWPIFFA